jgi:hypothetical protein
MKEQTPVEALIKDLEQFAKFPMVNKATIEAAIDFAKLRLPEERKVIEEAYNLGSARTEYDDGFGMNLTISSEQYFTTKFKQ